MIKQARIRTVKSDRSFHITNFIVLTLILLVVLYPLVYVVSCSFSSAYAVVTNQVWLWPVEITLDGYRAVFEHPLIMTGYANSLIYMVFGTMVNIVLLVLCGFPLSRKDLPGRKFWTVYFMLTMFFNGGMIPNYLLVKNLGMMNTRLALIIPFAFSAYNMVIVRTFFVSSLPDELMEAANIDGCGDIHFFFRIALPLAKPVIAVMVLLHGIGHWNGYMRALLYISDSSKFTLQLVLRDILMISKMPAEVLAQMSDARLDAMRNAVELIRYAVIVVGALPVLILYPFVQKYFVKGIMIGSIKG
ncbi:carbohydrate ABC transporter permease [Eubacteriales bacterium OttesenSCG-928-A19]|nr:carbohydrate ABC transporter permease [Eubacteriales bacterium OttesenSCG-928-A19]